MHFEADQLYHVYNRGNNHRPLFLRPAHYLLFLRKLRAHIRPHAHLLAYCLMPNHFHLLCPTADGTRAGPTRSSAKQPLTRGLAVALSSYFQALNKEAGNSGAVFQPKTKSRQLTAGDGRYPRACFHYIHQTPLRARLTRRLADWPYTSYRDYAGLRSGSLCNQELARQLLDLPLSCADFQAESAQAIDPQRMQDWL